MTSSPVSTHLAPVPRSPVVAYRDDGPLSTLFGRAAYGQLAPLPPAIASLAVVSALLASGITGARDLAVFTPIVTLLLAGPTSSHSHNGRLDWLVPPILRVTEYGFLAGAGFAWDCPPMLILAVLVAIAFHHYDVVYRVRAGLYPPGWLNVAGLGWEGRMILAGLAVLAGMVTFAYLVLAGYLLSLFFWESVTSWLATRKEKA